jgi:hypothetical protein
MSHFFNANTARTLYTIYDHHPHPFNNQKGDGFMGLQKLMDEIELLKAEYEKFDRGNKSAGTRARKSLQNIKKICQEIRIQIQEAKSKEE